MILRSTLVALLLLVTNGASAQQQTQKEVKVDYVTSGIGSIAYNVGLTLEGLSASKHPWLRISMAEGPGCLGAFYGALKQPEQWASRVFCVDLLAIAQAQDGIKPFDRKYASPMKNVRILANYNVLYGFLVTLDPSIKTEKDLANKTVALGRRSQGAWGISPTIALQQLSPELKIRLDYLDPNSAMNAMLDGRAAAAVSWLQMSADYSIKVYTPPLQELISTGKKFYWVGLSDDVVRRSHAAGVAGYLQPTQLPQGALPGAGTTMPGNIMLMRQAGMLTVMDNFPENVAYEIVKLMLRERSALLNAARAIFADPQNMVALQREEDFHPGALRAYREAGVMK